MIEIKGTSEGIKADIHASQQELSKFMGVLIENIIKRTAERDTVDALILVAIINKATTNGLEAALLKVEKSDGGLPS